MGFECHCVPEDRHVHQVQDRGHEAELEKLGELTREMGCDNQ